MSQLHLPIFSVRLYDGNSDDLFRLWQWRNDVAVRKLKTGMVPIQDYARSLETVQTLIAECDGTPVGYAQYEVSGEMARLFWMIDKDKRRMGLGARLAKATAEHVLKIRLTPYVKVQPGSATVIAALESIGFVRESVEDGRLVMTYGA